MDSQHLGNGRFAERELHGLRSHGLRSHGLRLHWGGLRRRLMAEDGAATAEYAVATMAAVGFAGLLVIILRGDEVRGILTDLIRRALTVSV